MIARDPPSGPGGTSQAVIRALAQGRSTGTVNLRGHDLSAVPPELYDLDSVQLPGGNDKWWEFCAIAKLNLSQNKIAEVSPRITVLADLRELNLASNALSQLPEEVAELPELRALVASENRLTALPSGMARLQFLAVLNVSHNQLSSLDCIPFSHMACLADLNVSHNHLARLPDDLGRCAALRVLDASHNRIEGLPEDLSGLGQLEQAVFNRNAIRRLPDSLGACVRLTRLELRENKVEHVGDGIGGCGGLTELFLGSNGMTRVPDGLFRLSKLSILDLSGNNIENLDPRCHQWKALTRLDLSNNQLRALPAELGLVSGMKALRIDGNPLRTIRSALLAPGKISELMEYLRSRLEVHPDEVAARKEDARQLENTVKAAQHTKAFDLSAGPWPVGAAGGAPAQGVEAALQSALSSVEGMKQLVVSGQGLSELPGDIGIRTPEIQVLRADRNQLTDLPASMTSLASLAELHLAKNRFTFIPWPILSLPTLTTLDLSDNALGRPGMDPVPAEFACLTALRSLNLQNVGLHSYPMATLQMPWLVELRLGRNKIPAVPDQVCGMERLAELDLTDNDVSSLPLSMGRMTWLRALHLDGNPLRSIRRNIVEKGTAAVLEYLRDRTPDAAPAQAQPAAADAGAIAELQKNIAELEEQMENFSLSQAQKFALKKKLQMERAKLIREQRKAN